MPPILEMRVAITTEMYDRLMDFYQNALGLDPAALWTTEHSRAALFELGRATVEIFDPAHAEEVDMLEVGQRVSGPIRFALQVPDVRAALERALAHGATLVHEPVVTPWNDYNARIQSPDGLQITLFQALKGE